MCASGRAHGGLRSIKTCFQWIIMSPSFVPYNPSQPFIVGIYSFRHKTALHKIYMWQHKRIPRKAKNSQVVRWIGGGKESYRGMMCINENFCRNHPGTRSRAEPRSLLEQSQHISHMRGLKTTRSGLPPSFRWKWTSSRGKTPFLTPLLATARPLVMCPVNGLWVYSTAGGPQHRHK